MYITIHVQVLTCYYFTNNDSTNFDFVWSDLSLLYCFFYITYWFRVKFN